ncbi:type IV secretion system protein [Burkholderia gladioli]|uniref:VirB8 family protein n=1 Tax=Burkholderia gladioli TaxID=28095 RepID=A0AAW3FCA9_BURGA|nr:type IV secretion system protein [Burkholderia gladioli]KGC24019.1 virB8 family protein [Burkholderia gladioli]
MKRETLTPTTTRLSSGRAPIRVGGSDVPVQEAVRPVPPVQPFARTDDAPERAETGGRRADREAARAEVSSKTPGRFGALKRKQVTPAPADGNGPPVESYQAMRVSRARAWVLAIAAWPIAGLSILGNVILSANANYVPPVVLTIGADNHVQKSEIGTPEVILSKDAIIDGEIARYLTERFSLNRAFRDDMVRYVDLHSTPDVAAAFDHEMDVNNRDNPYYKLPQGVSRKVKDVRVRVFDRDAKKGEATLVTVEDGSGADNKPIYWHVRFQYDVVKQALSPADRYINSTGFVMTAYQPNTEPGPSSLTAGE